MYVDEHSPDRKKKDRETKLADAQRLFRNLLSDQASDVYFSLCQDEICSSDNDWHCAVCKRCMDWRVWHCDKCNRCMYFEKKNHLTDDFHLMECSFFFFR